MASVDITPDSSANGLDGVLVGSASIATAATGFGSGVVFSGTDAGAATDAVWCGTGTAYGLSGGQGSVEFRVKRTRSGTQEEVIGQWSGTSTECAFLVYFDASDKINYAFYDSGASFHNLAATASIADTAWHAVEFSWDGTTVRCFVDGTAAGTLSFSGTPRVAVAETPLTLGRGDTTNNAFAGMLDEVRLSSVARHTSGYTPATAPFSADADTVLLLHLDSAAPTAKSLVRVQTTPVLAKGGTYGGVQVDAFAAPACCWDGSRFVMQVSGWNVAGSKWHTLYFTSTDLKSWSYVSGSIRSPTGSDYIFGNGGIAWFAGKYYVANNHYPFGSPVSGIRVDHSTDLLTWTNDVDGAIDGSGYDPDLAVNPNSGNLECWFLDSGRILNWADSPDGATWTARGQVLAPGFNATNFGEPAILYAGGARYLVADGGTSAGHRNVQMYRGPDSSVTLGGVGEVLSPSGSNAWENAQVFDCAAVGSFDLGDGNGTRLWFLYAGGDNNSSTDDTDSSIGLAYLDPGAGAAYSDSVGLAASSGLALASAASFGSSLGLAASSGFSDGGGAKFPASAALPATSAQAQSAALSGVGSVALAAASAVGFSDSGAAYSVSAALAATSGFAPSTALSASASVALAGTSGLTFASALNSGGTSYSESVALAAASGLASSGSLAISASTTLAASAACGHGLPAPLAGATLLACSAGLLLVGEGGTASTLPASLRAALVAFWADQGLDATIAPIRSDRTLAGELPPFVLLKARKGSAALLTSTSTWHEYRVTFRVRALSAADGSARAKAITEAFDGQTFAWDGGASTAFVRQGWDSDTEPKPTAGGKWAYEDLIEYQTRILGTR
jgi:hypothetical protein